VLIDENEGGGGKLPACLPGSRYGGRHFLPGPKKEKATGFAAESPPLSLLEPTLIAPGGCKEILVIDMMIVRK
jgi:hypothetical protein